MSQLMRLGNSITPNLPSPIIIHRYIKSVLKGPPILRPAFVPYSRIRARVSNAPAGRLGPSFRETGRIVPKDLFGTNNWEGPLSGTPIIPKYPHFGLLNLGYAHPKASNPLGVVPKDLFGYE